MVTRPLAHRSSVIDRSRTRRSRRARGGSRPWYPPRCRGHPAKPGRTCCGPPHASRRRRSGSPHGPGPQRMFNSASPDPFPGDVRIDGHSGQSGSVRGREAAPAQAATSRSWNAASATVVTPATRRSSSTLKKIGNVRTVNSSPGTGDKPARGVSHSLLDLVPADRAGQPTAPADSVRGAWSCRRQVEPLGDNERRTSGHLPVIAGPGRRAATSGYALAARPNANAHFHRRAAPSLAPRKGWRRREVDRGDRVRVPKPWTDASTCSTDLIPRQRPSC